MRRIDLIGRRRTFFVISGVAVLVSLVLLAVFGLRPGIEFTSGTTMLVRFDSRVQQEDLRAVYATLGHADARVQSTGTNEYLIRTRELEVPEGSFTEVAPPVTGSSDGVGPQPLEELGTITLGAEDAEGQVLVRNPFQGDACNLGSVAGRFDPGTPASVVEILEHCADGTVYRVVVDDTTIGYVAAENTHAFESAEEEAPAITEDAGERTVIEQALLDEFGTFEVLEFASVSAVVSTVAVRNAAVAVVVASLFIMGYVFWAFAGLPRPFRYAVSAIVALVHDVVIVLGAFALFGVLFGTEVNLMFVTGLLTVIGFSVHDTIVTFDRLRENIRTAPNASLAENVNSALLQTMARSFNTSLTLMITVAAMLALGGVTIREFLLVILVGALAGTYSSIALAPQLLVAWEEGELRRIGLGRPSEEPRPASAA